MPGTKNAYSTLTQYLAGLDYVFVCPSPESQARVVQKRRSNASTKYAQSAQDFFSWNLLCTRQALKSVLPDDLFDSLHEASIIVDCDAKYYRSTIRISNFYTPSVPNFDTNDVPLYYVHSSFPASSDSVFFGPDTYLFVTFLRTITKHLPHPPSSIVDVCCGSGAGAIHMSKTYPQAKVFGLDLNPRALKLGSVNAQLASAKVDFYESNLYASIPHDSESRGIDIIVSNPPYIASSADGEDLPIYANGGAEFGLDISIRIVEEGARFLSSDGIIVVYTGVAIPTAHPGHDAFLQKLRSVANAEIVEYTVLHPDMWPEEIGRGAYADVCRIQVVGAVIRVRYVQSDPENYRPV